MITFANVKRVEWTCQELNETNGSSVPLLYIGKRTYAATLQMPCRKAWCEHAQLIAAEIQSLADLGGHGVMALKMPKVALYPMHYKLHLCTA